MFFCSLGLARVRCLRRTGRARQGQEMPSIHVLRYIRDITRVFALYCASGFRLRLPVVCLAVRFCRRLHREPRSASYQAGHPAKIESQGHARLRLRPLRRTQSHRALFQFYQTVQRHRHPLRKNRSQLPRGPLNAIRLIKNVTMHGEDVRALTGRPERVPGLWRSHGSRGSRRIAGFTHRNSATDCRRDARPNNKWRTGKTYARATYARANNRL